MTFRLVPCIKFSLIVTITLLQLFADARLVGDEEHSRQLKRVSPAVENAVGMLPGWLREYAKWHRYMRENKMNDPNTKFLTLACHRDFPCGGVSDRLRPIPYFLLAAFKTGRVFLIKWQKYDLEDFLEPPPGGIDWRMPSDFDLYERPYQQRSCLVREDNRPCNIWERTENKWWDKKNLLALSRDDLYKEYKDFFVTDQRPNGTFRQMIDILFQPVPSLQKYIDETMSALHLDMKQYVSAHFRYRYPYLPDRSAIMPTELKRTILHNAIACAVEIGGDTKLPVYFTSDEAGDVSYMVDRSPYAESNSPVKLIALTDMQRKHSDDKSIQYEKDDPKDLYPVFLDLWLMGNGRCVAYGQGGFGLFGARLSGEDCMIQHQVLWNHTDCRALI